MNRDKFFGEWSSLHGDAKIEGAVRWWLNISYRLVKPLAAIKVSPNLLTFLGLISAIALWLTSSNWIAVIYLALSLIFDGIDGSLAIVRGITSKQGAVIDSVVDRIAEIFWALALYILGAPAGVLFIATLFAFTQEYIRARAGGLGFAEIGVVTFSERPVRASLVLIGLLMSHVTKDGAAPVAFLWFLMQLIALIQVVRSSKKRLSSSSSQ